MQKLMDYIHYIGFFMFGIGLGAVSSLIPVIEKISRDPFMYKLYYGYDIADFLVYLALSVILTAAGILAVYVGFFRAKSRNALAATENLANRNYCYNCHVNISPDTHVCPICSQEIKEK